MPLESLGAISVKLERANKHVVEFDKARQVFLGKNPYTIRAKDNLKTGERAYYLSSLTPIPAQFSAIIGDALQNFRTALDYSVNQMVRAAGNIPDSSTAFPIASSAEKYTEEFFGRKINGLRQEAKELIHSLKPYQGGNEALWRLHYLNNIDKHRLLLPAVTGHHFHSLLPSQRAELARIYLGSHPWSDAAPELRGTFIPPKHTSFPLKKGSIFLTVAKSDIEDDMKFVFDIALDQTGVVDGIMVLPILQQIARTVTDIVWSFSRANLL
jgi:hypothetical protein